MWRRLLGVNGVVLKQVFLSKNTDLMETFFFFFYSSFANILVVFFLFFKATERVFSLFIYKKEKIFVLVLICS